MPFLDSGESLFDPKDTVAQGVTPSSLLEAVLGWDTGKANTQWNPVTPGPPCPGPSQPPTKFRERFLIFSTPNVGLPRTPCPSGNFQKAVHELLFAMLEVQRRSVHGLWCRPYLLQPVSRPRPAQHISCSAFRRLKSSQDTADCVGSSGDSKGHRPSWDLSSFQLVPSLQIRDVTSSAIVTALAFVLEKHVLREDTLET